MVLTFLSQKKALLDYSARNNIIVNIRVFYENNNWYIVDGSGFRASLNGTWYLADEYMDIYEGMIFRAGTTSFQAHIYDS